MGMRLALLSAAVLTCSVGGQALAQSSQQVAPAHISYQAPVFQGASVPVRSTVRTETPGARPPSGSGTYRSTRTTWFLPESVTVAPVAATRPLQFPRPVTEISVSPALGRPSAGDQKRDAKKPEASKTAPKKPVEVRPSMSIAPVVVSPPRLDSPASIELWRTEPLPRGKDDL
jgi:hypothetical protein